jgi:hypothetical protein
LAELERAPQQRHLPSLGSQLLGGDQTILGRDAAVGGLKIGVAWYGVLRRSGQPFSGTDAEAVGSSRVRWVVRRDWPDGTHEFVRPRDTETRAHHQSGRDRAFWRRGPMRPELSVVCISERDFALHGRHRRDCRTPDCRRAQLPAAGVEAA